MVHFSVPLDMQDLLSIAVYLAVVSAVVI